MSSRFEGAPAPIALFVFNRPDHTQRTLDALQRNPLHRESELYVFCDGPKVPEQNAGVARVREIVRGLSGFRDVHITERETNLGLAASITDGVTRLCAEHGKVIVLEDDLVVSPRFLDFMNKGLRRYADEEKVKQISGYMYPGDFGGSGDTLFLPMTSCWGWATWKRAWDQYDASMAGYGRLESDPQLAAEFNLNGAFDYLGMLEMQRRGDIDSWGILWHLSVFMLGGVVLYPAESLVINVGIDGSGTHGHGTPGLQMLDHMDPSTSGNVNYPMAVQPDDEALRMVGDGLLATRPTFYMRLKRKLFG